MSQYHCTNCGKRLYDGDDCDCGDEEAQARDGYEAGKTDWMLEHKYARENP